MENARQNVYLLSRTPNSAENISRKKKNSTLAYFSLFQHTLVCPNIPQPTLAYSSIPQSVLAPQVYPSLPYHWPQSALAPSLLQPTISLSPRSLAQPSPAQPTLPESRNCQAPANPVPAPTPTLPCFALLRPNLPFRHDQTTIKPFHPTVTSFSILGSTSGKFSFSNLGAHDSEIMTLHKYETASLW